MKIAFLTSDSKSGPHHTAMSIDFRMTANVYGKNNNLICHLFKVAGFDMCIILLERKRLVVCNGGQERIENEHPRVLTALLCQPKYENIFLHFHFMRDLANK